MNQPELLINFSGRDWTIVKDYLKRMKEVKVGLLIQEGSHDKSNQIRGSLAMIGQILALEDAALRAANTQG